MAKKQPQPPARRPGTYPPPPGYYWSKEPGISTAIHIVMGIGGLFTFGILWIVWLIMVAVTPAVQTVLRPIPVMYTAPLPQAPVNPQLPRPEQNGQA